MNYKVLEPPFALRFRSMSQKEADRYFDWFLEIIPSRISILEIAVKTSDGYYAWEADASPVSLDMLGKWFCENVETRSRSEAEITKIYAGSPEWFKQVEVPDWELTNSTFSMAFDLGMYFSQVLVLNVPNLRWKLITKPKRDVSYHQPVLVGSGKLVFNPVHIMVTYAYGIGRQKRGPGRLRELYEIWADILQTGSA